MGDHNDHNDQNDQNDQNTKDGGVKDALANDWEQTKNDLPGLDGKDMDQD